MEQNKIAYMEEKRMCRKLVVTNQLGLGNRVLGWETYSLPKGEVLEFTEKQLATIIKQGKDEVYGLKLSDDGMELVADEKFFVSNFMYKVHVGSLRPLMEVENGCLVNLFYIVIGTHTEKNETLYDVVSSRYERTSFGAEKIKMLLEMGVVSAGAKLENGEIVVAPLSKKVEKEKPVDKVAKNTTGAKK